MVALHLSRIRTAIAYLKSSPDDGDGPLGPGRTAPTAPVMTDLGNGLLVAYLVDADAHLHYVQHSDLTETGLTAGALHEIGVTNLARLASARLEVENAGPIHGVLLDGTFEASVMLVDDFWNGALARHAPHGFMIAVPSRDVLAFCDAESEEGRRELRSVVERVTRMGDHLVSERLYRRRANGWRALADA